MKYESVPPTIGEIAIAIEKVLMGARRTPAETADSNAALDALAVLLRIAREKRGSCVFKRNRKGEWHCSECDSSLDGFELNFCPECGCSVEVAFGGGNK